MDSRQRHSGMTDCSPADGDTVYTLLSRAVFLLGEAGIDNPRLEAELLMALALGTNRAGVLARLKDAPGGAAAEAFLQAAVRRATHEPLQYITGSVEFCGLEFKVNESVLVPRPETELLVEEAVRFLSNPPGMIIPKEGPTHGSDPTFNPRTVADIGTGSGCIAVCIAHEVPGAVVYAVDSSPAALAVAGANAVSHGVSDRVRLLAGDLFGPLREEGVSGLDLIVSNPPYIPSADIPGLQAEVLREPLSALDGGPDGLDAVRRLVAEAPTFLRPGGRLMVETGFGQADAVESLVREGGALSFVGFLVDFAGIKRILIAEKV